MAFAGEKGGGGGGEGFRLASPHVDCVGLRGEEFFVRPVPACWIGLVLMYWCLNFVRSAGRRMIDGGTVEVSRPSVDRDDVVLQFCLLGFLLRQLLCLSVSCLEILAFNRR